MVQVQGSEVWVLASLDPLPSTFTRSNLYTFTLSHVHTFTHSHIHTFTPLHIKKRPTTRDGDRARLMRHLRERRQVLVTIYP